MDVTDDAPLASLQSSPEIRAVMQDLWPKEIGTPVGAGIGLAVGVAVVGALVGTPVGKNVGALVGFPVSEMVGAAVQDPCLSRKHYLKCLA